jgi:hypothetical protein
MPDDFEIELIDAWMIFVRLQVELCREVEVKTRDNTVVPQRWHS